MGIVLLWKNWIIPLQWFLGREYLASKYLYWKQIGLWHVFLWSLILLEPRWPSHSFTLLWTHIVFGNFMYSHTHFVWYWRCWMIFCSFSFFPLFWWHTQAKAQVKQASEVLTLHYQKCFVSHRTAIIFHLTARMCQWRSIYLEICWQNLFADKVFFNLNF